MEDLAEAESTGILQCMLTKYILEGSMVEPAAFMLVALTASGIVEPSASGKVE